MTASEGAEECAGAHVKSTATPAASATPPSSPTCSETDTGAPPPAPQACPHLARSLAMHKRINPGYVDIPYVSTHQSDYVHADFNAFNHAGFGAEREFLKRPSDAKFGKFLDEAVKKHVDLKKTSH